jgi:hypothetical protein
MNLSAFAELTGGRDAGELFPDLNTRRMEGASEGKQGAMFHVEQKE